RAAIALRYLSMAALAAAAGVPGGLPEPGSPGEPAGAVDLAPPGPEPLASEPRPFPAPAPPGPMPPIAAPAPPASVVAVFRPDALSRCGRAAPPPPQATSALSASRTT